MTVQFLFIHAQNCISSSPPVPLEVDDFHSPTTPDRYIELRLRPVVEFYRRRVPIYTR